MCERNEYSGQHLDCVSLSDGLSEEVQRYEVRYAPVMLCQLIYIHRGYSLRAMKGARGRGAQWQSEEDGRRRLVCGDLHPIGGETKGQRDIFVLQNCSDRIER